MSHADWGLLARVAVGFALCYLLGFERQVRGAPAGNRTFALVGAASAAITSVVAKTSPQAVAGVITGIGFIGGGLVFRGRGGSPRGVTTAATIFAAAGIGIVVGYGHLLLGAMVAFVVLVTLELPHVPGLNLLDARNFRSRLSHDPLYDTEPDDDEES